jgi:anti-anti-sigma factor
MAAGSDTEWMGSAMNAVTETGVRHALLDLAQVSLLDCSGIGQLLRLREQMHGARRTLALVNLERRQKRMLELSGLLHVFRVFTTCEAGMASLGVAPVRRAAPPPEMPAPMRPAACWGVDRSWQEMGWVS